MTALNTYKIRWDSGPTIVNFNFRDMFFLSMCTCIGKYCFVFGYFLYQFNYMAFGLLTTPGRNDLQIGCLNVRGIGDKQKRREMFNWLRAKKFSIYLLQEVHCSENTAAIWSAEWGYKTLFSCCSSAKGGVAILFNNNFAFQIQWTYLDTTGRFIICDIKTEEKYITFATIYAPNDDEPAFFQNFFEHLLDFRWRE